MSTHQSTELDVAAASDTNNSISPHAFSGNSHPSRSIMTSHAISVVNSVAKTIQLKVTLQDLLARKPPYAGFLRKLKMFRLSTIVLPYSEPIHKTPCAVETVYGFQHHHDSAIFRYGNDERVCLIETILVLPRPSISTCTTSSKSSSAQSSPRALIKTNTVHAFAHTSISYDLDATRSPLMSIFDSSTLWYLVNIVPDPHRTKSRYRWNAKFQDLA